MNRASVRLALAAAFLLVTGTTLHAVRGYEQTLSGGRMVLVELAPVDPRSLMQGDYMALAFVIDRALAERWSDARELGEAPPRFAYLALDAEGRASLAGTGDALSPGEAGQVTLRIRTRGGMPSIGPNAFFFQEGTAERFERAQWGEFRVAADGKALLTHLRDEALEQLE
jgi:uncharacterized membrane-anchored protein